MAHLGRVNTEIESVDMVKRTLTQFRLVKGRRPDLS